MLPILSGLSLWIRSAGLNVRLLLQAGLALAVYIFLRFGCDMSECFFPSGSAVVIILSWKACLRSDIRNTGKGGVNVGRRTSNMAVGDRVRDEA